MRILFLPYNLAFVQLTNAEELARRGHEVVFIALEQHKWKSELVKVVNIPFFKPKESLLMAFWSLVRYHLLCIKYFFWADIIQYIYEPPYPGALEVRMSKFFKGKKFVEWVGSDIRIPEITMRESPWYKEVYYNGYEYADVESKGKSLKLQKTFANAGYTPMVVPEMSLFLQKQFFQRFEVINYRFDIKGFIPQYPNVEKGEVIKVVHAPSKLKAKGSHLIVPILEKLKTEGLLEYLLIHNMPREEVLTQMRACDLYIDQIILGSYAGAAMEAMAMGKPVMAYIMPSVFDAGVGRDCPVVNVNPDNLEKNIRLLVADPTSFCKIGEKSRNWVEKVHDVSVLTNRIEQIYSEN